MGSGALNIFLSYSWADFESASMIDADLTSMGLRVTRDIRDINYMDDIPEFMQRISNSDFVVILISDSYLRSENCMYESLELLNSHKFDKKVLPIILPPVNFYKPEYSSLYYKYWDEQIEACAKLLKEYPAMDIIKTLKHRKSIRNSLDEVITVLKGRLIKTFDEVKAEGYKSLIEKIGFSDEKVWEDIFSIKASNLEELELGFEEVEKKWGSNKYIYLAKAARAELAGQYIKAEKYYKDGIAKHPKFASLLNDYGDFLLSRKNDLDKAEEMFQLAIKEEPGFSMAWNNLGLITELKHNERSKGFSYYERAVLLDVNNSIAQRNLGLVYLETNRDKKGLEHMQRALKINPIYYQAYCDLGAYYGNKQDFNLALKYFKNSLDINPDYEYAKHSMAMLLANEYKMYDQAIQLFEELLQANPDNAIFHIDYALFCLKPLKKVKKATEHILIASSLNLNESLRRVTMLFGDNANAIVSMILKNKKSDVSK